MGARAGLVLDEERPWCRRDGADWLLDVRVQPASSVTTVVGELGAELKIRLAAPPVDGKANAELVRYLAKQLGVPRSAVGVVRGQASRSKTVRVSP